MTTVPTPPTHLDPCPVGGFHAYRADTGACACGAASRLRRPIDGDPPALRQLRQLRLELTAARVLLATDAELSGELRASVLDGMRLAESLIVDQVDRLTDAHASGQL